MAYCAHCGNEFADMLADPTQEPICPQCIDRQLGASRTAAARLRPGTAAATPAPRRDRTAPTIDDIADDELILDLEPIAGTAPAARAPAARGTAQRNAPTPAPPTKRRETHPTLPPLTGPNRAGSVTAPKPAPAPRPSLLDPEPAAPAAAPAAPRRTAPPPPARVAEPAAAPTAEKKSRHDEIRAGTYIIALCTTEGVPGHTTVSYRGFVSAHRHATSAQLTKHGAEQAARETPAATCDSALDKVQHKVLTELKLQANDLGANAVIGLTVAIDQIPVGLEALTCVRAYGTAVSVEPAGSPKRGTAGPGL